MYSVNLALAMCCALAGAASAQTPLVPVGIAARELATIPTRELRSRRIVSCLPKGALSDQPEARHEVAETFVLPDDLGRHDALDLRIERLWIDAETVVVRRPIRVGEHSSLLITANRVRFEGVGELQAASFGGEASERPILIARCAPLESLAGVAIVAESVEVSAERAQVLHGDSRFGLAVTTITRASGDVLSPSALGGRAFGETVLVAPLPGELHRSIARDVLWPQVRLSRLRADLVAKPFDENVRERVVEDATQLLAVRLPLRGAVSSEALELRELATRGLSIHGQDAYFLPLMTMGAVEERLAKVLPELVPALQMSNATFLSATAKAEAVRIARERLTEQRRNSVSALPRLGQSVEQLGVALERAMDAFAARRDEAAVRQGELEQAAQRHKWKLESLQHKAKERARLANTLNSAAILIGPASGGASTALSIAGGAATSYANARNAEQLCGTKMERLPFFSGALAQYRTNREKGVALTEQLSQTERAVRHGWRGARCYVTNSTRAAANACLGEASPSLKVAETSHHKAPPANGKAEQSAPVEEAYDWQFRTQRAASAAASAGEALVALASLEFSSVDIPACEGDQQLPAEVESATKALVAAKEGAAKALAEVEQQQARLAAAIVDLGRASDAVRTSDAVANADELLVDQQIYLIDGLRLERQRRIAEVASLLEALGRWLILQDRYRHPLERAALLGDVYALQRRLLDLGIPEYALDDVALEDARQQIDGFLASLGRRLTFPVAPQMREQTVSVNVRRDLPVAWATLQTQIGTIRHGPWRLSVGLGRLPMAVEQLAGPLSIRAITVVATWEPNASTRAPSATVLMEPWGEVHDAILPIVTYCLGPDLENRGQPGTRAIHQCGNPDPRSADLGGAYTLAYMPLDTAGGKATREIEQNVILPPWGGIRVELSGSDLQTLTDLTLNVVLGPSR